MYKTILLLVAVCFGAVITYIDSRPNWDDTGITAMAILLTCVAFAFFAPNRWWLWAIAVGLWIPVLGIVRTQNFAAILALVIAFIGAFLGMLIRNAVSGKPASTT